MEKKELLPMALLFPMPLVLVGANVEGKPNFLTVAYCGIVNIQPPIISVALGKSHYSNPGIRKNGTFSVNIPSVDMAEVTDYCGLFSGHNLDKSGVFKTFYGKLETAPMIEETPINLECKLIRTIEFDVHDAFLGEIVSVYAGKEIMTGNIPDVLKIKPLIFSTSNGKYYNIGDEVGKAWSIGKQYSPNKAEKNKINSI